MKCDETKPACLKCTHTGRKCDGYPIAGPHHMPRAPQKDPGDLTSPNSNSIARVPLETTSFYSLPFKIPGSQNDRQLFHYFCVHASQDLAGFSCGALDFWGQFVLECSHDEPVVRGALIAIASAHRKFVTKEAPADGIVNPMKEYNKAIRRLHNKLRGTPKQESGSCMLRAVLLL